MTIDNTKGTKCNRVELNIAQVHGAIEPPEPGIAAIIVDGTPILVVHYINIEAGVGRPTKVTLQFEAEVSGKIGNVNVAEEIDRLRNED
jgi:hypothetical protein